MPPRGRNSRGRTPKPEVGQLMREGKHLSRLGVRTVDKHERRQSVSHCKSAKLVRIEPPGVVIQHDAAAHDQRAQCVRLRDEVT